MEQNNDLEELRYLVESHYFIYTLYRPQYRSNYYNNNLSIIEHTIQYKSPYEIDIRSMFPLLNFDNYVYTNLQSLTDYIRFDRPALEYVSVSLSELEEKIRVHVRKMLMRIQIAVFNWMKMMVDLYRERIAHYEPIIDYIDTDLKYSGMRIKRIHELEEAGELSESERGELKRIREIEQKESIERSSRYEFTQKEERMKRIEDAIFEDFKKYTAAIFYLYDMRPIRYVDLIDCSDDDDILKVMIDWEWSPMSIPDNFDMNYVLLVDILNYPMQLSKMYRREYFLEVPILNSMFAEEDIYSMFGLYDREEVKEFDMYMNYCRKHGIINTACRIFNEDKGVMNREVLNVIEEMIDVDMTSGNFLMIHNANGDMIHVPLIRPNDNEPSVDSEVALEQILFNRNTEVMNVFNVDENQMEEVEINIID